MNSKSLSAKKIPRYVDGLDAICRARYLNKLKLIADKDPYELPKSEFSSDPVLFPAVTYPDIVNYLVNTQSAYTLEQMKSFKSLESYNYFVSGWVNEVGSWKVKNDVCLIAGRVRHSQSMNETPLHAWIVSEKNGNILTAHCNCMAGLGESCSHIGALLFFVEATVKLRDSQTVTQEKAYWLLPTAVKKVGGKRVREIDFTSARSKKRKLDQSIEGNSSPASKKVTPDIPKPTTNEVNELFQKLHNSCTKPVLLSLVPEYCDSYVPEVLSKKYPVVFSELQDEDMISANRDTVIEYCQNLKQKISVTFEEIANVEEITRGQAQSREWHRFRTGRVTASKIKSVCKTSLSHPSQSLIKGICYPSLCKFSNDATKWGCKHEKDAMASYVRHMKVDHENFHVKTSGFVISKKYPFLGASPDGIASCDCCGKICVEIKCPYCKRDSLVAESCDKNFCLERDNDAILKLKRNHQYYYQVQCQLLVCEMEFVDFVLWTNIDFHVERIGIDLDFCYDMVLKSEDFFYKTILPELVGKMYSRPTPAPVLGKSVLQSTPIDNVENTKDIIVCTCRQVFNKDTDNVIGCDNENCPYVWLHFKCVSIRRAPKGDWYCPTCRKLPEYCKKK